MGSLSAFYRPELVDVQLHSKNLNTNKHEVIAKDADYEKLKVWLNCYAEQNDMQLRQGKYWNDNECVWIWVKKA